METDDGDDLWGVGLGVSTLGPFFFMSVLRFLVLRLSLAVLCVKSPKCFAGLIFLSLLLQFDPE